MAVRLEWILCIKLAQIWINPVNQAEFVSQALKFGTLQKALVVPNLVML